MHSDDASDVLNSKNAGLSAFLRNKDLEGNMSAYVGWGLDKYLCIKQLLPLLLLP